MLTSILIISSVCAFSLNTAATRFFQLYVQKSPLTIRLYQSLFCLLAAILNIAFYGCDGEISAFTVICAVCFGIIFAAATHAASICYESGPMSLSAVIINLSLAIPLAYSCFAFSEKITVVRWIGLALLLITFILTGFSQKSTVNKRMSLKWALILAVAFAFNGFTAVIQKQHQLTSGRADGVFLFTAYMCAAVYFLIVYLTSNKDKKPDTAKKRESIGLFITAVVLAGAGTFVGNALLNTLSISVDASLLYPEISGGTALLSSVASFVFFKEKISFIKAVAAAVGIAAIIMLAM